MTVTQGHVQECGSVCYNQDMSAATEASPLFSRNLRKQYPLAVRGEGSWIIAADGRRYLDASGQAAVVSIGHGVPEIGRAMAEQSNSIAFAHTSQFHTAPAEKLAARVLALAPKNFHDAGRVYFTSGGSEATETAIKLVRQYFLERKQNSRYRVIARKQSYHGSTLGAMSVSGNVARRAPYAPMLPEWGHVAPCFCYPLSVRQNISGVPTRLRRRSGRISASERRVHSRCIHF